MTSFTLEAFLILFPQNKPSLFHLSHMKEELKQETTGGTANHWILNQVPVINAKMISF